MVTFFISTTFHIWHFFYLTLKRCLIWKDDIFVTQHLFEEKCLMSCLYFLKNIHSLEKLFTQGFADIFFPRLHFSIELQNQYACYLLRKCY